MATFGSLPGIQVSTTGGAVSGVTVGRSQYLVLVGHGTSAGTASTNTVVDIESRSDADTKFGADSDLSRAYRDALANGANKNYAKGVMAKTTSVTDETFGSGTTPVSSGTLANTPIVDDLDTVTVTDSGATMTVKFVYDATVSAPTDADTVHLNPVTGEWAADSGDTYKFDYDYADWSGALTAAENALSEGEFGLLAVLSNAESVASSLASTLGSMRTAWKMALGLMAAEPNATTATSRPKYDTSAYSDNIDDDTLFLVAPDTEEDTDTSILGAVAGVFAGNDTSDPIYNDVVSGVSDLAQELSKSEASDLRKAEVIPIRDRGSIRIRDNLSTSTKTDWERDYWRRRIVDLTIATVKEVGEAILGFINDSDARATAESLIEAELEDFVDDGLLVPNKDGEANMYVDVYKKNADEVGIDLGITPYGIVKEVDVSLTINT